MCTFKTVYKLLYFQKIFLSSKNLPINLNQENPRNSKFSQNFLAISKTFAGLNKSSERRLPPIVRARQEKRGRSVAVLCQGGIIRERRQKPIFNSNIPPSPNHQTFTFSVFLTHFRKYTSDNIFYDFALVQ